MVIVFISRNKHRDDVLCLRAEVTIKVNRIIPWVLGKYGTTPQSTCIDQYIQSTKDILLLASNRNLT